MGCSQSHLHKTTICVFANSTNLNNFAANKKSCFFGYFQQKQHTISEWSNAFVHVYTTLAYISYGWLCIRESRRERKKKYLILGHQLMSTTQRWTTEVRKKRKRHKKRIEQISKFTLMWFRVHTQQTYYAHHHMCADRRTELNSNSNGMIW